MLHVEHFTCVDALHVVIADIEAPEAPCALEISGSEMTD